MGEVLKQQEFVFVNYTLLQRHGTMMILIYIYIYKKTDKSLLTVLVSRVVNHDLQYMYLNFRNKNGISFSTNFLPFHYRNVT